MVFGKVVSGMDVVHKIEAEGKQNGTPKSNVVVVDSGELHLWFLMFYFTFLPVLFNWKTFWTYTLIRTF